MNGLPSMLSSCTAITAHAEAALAQITARVADHRQLTRLEARNNPPGGRRLRQAPSVRHGNALVDLVAVAESFTTARLLSLRPAVSADDVSTWDSRERAWANHGPVNMTTYSAWSALMGFVEVRNALQHGLGRLTDRQLGKHRDKVLARIGASAVHLDGDLLVVLAEDVGHCGQVCADFVCWLDGIAPSS